MARKNRTRSTRPKNKAPMASDASGVSTKGNSSVTRAIIIAGALIAVGIVASSLLQKNVDDDRIMSVSSPAVQSTSSSNPSLESSPFFETSQEIASLFYCGCGECGDMVLSTCVCESPNGGIAERRFISDQLKAGLKKDDVVEMVKLRFGRMIAEETLRTGFDQQDESSVLE